jgi:hypothetical protein
MSQLGKIFLYVAAAGLVTAAVFGWLVIGKYNDTKTSLDSQVQATSAAQADAAKQKKAAEAAAIAQSTAEKSLADTKAQLDDLNTKLTAATAKADEAQKAIDEAKAEGAKAAADLAAINAKLNGQSVDDILAARTKAETDLASSQSEQKVLTDQLQDAQGQIEQLKKDINAKATGAIPPGVSGKVTFVNRTWNFVVLDVGLSNGVVPNGQLIVYRKNAFLGKVKVTTADANSCVADILPDAKGDIQVGDYVLN